MYIIFTFPFIFRSVSAGVLLSLLLSNKLNADNIITSGTFCKVVTGTTVVSTDHLVIRNGAVLNNSGTIIFKKNLTSEHISPVSVGTGTFEFSDNTVQTITGQIVFQNLTLDNSSGLSLAGNTNVNGNLTLTSGSITLGDNNLLLGVPAVIIGTPSASLMIIATGTGELRKEFPSGFTGSFTYPVGNLTGIAEYSPVTLAILSGSFITGNYVGVSLSDTKYPDPGITGNYLNRYWTLSQSGITGLLCNATFQYLSADITGTEDLISCTRVNPLPWTTFALTNAATHVLTATGLSSLSSFTGLKSTTTPQNQELVNITIPNGVTDCYDAVQILTVAGNGNTFLVENGGSVTLIAGVKISLMPGVTVNSGGYMLAKISMDFCNTLLNPLVINPESLDKMMLSLAPVDKQGWIKIYPNPTEEVVILEFSPTESPSTAYVTIYSMTGQTISKKTIKDEGKHPFSLAGFPVGIYVIQVRSDTRTEIAKIVKK